MMVSVSVGSDWRLTVGNTEAYVTQEGGQQQLSFSFNTQNVESSFGAFLELRYLPFRVTHWVWQCP